MHGNGDQDSQSAEGFFGEGGTEEYKDDVVEVRSGVRLTKEGAATSYNDAISITLYCSENPHIVQFVYREIVGVDGQRKRRRVKTAAGAYDTTTDADHPVWNTDSAAKPEPYYETGGTRNRRQDGLLYMINPLLPQAWAKLGVRPSKHTSFAAVTCFVRYIGCAARSTVIRRGTRPP